MKRFLVAAALLIPIAVGCGPSKKQLAAANGLRIVGSSKLGEGDPEGALADLSQAHKLDPKNAEITDLLGLAYWSKGRLVSDDTLRGQGEKYILESFAQKKSDGKDVPGDWHNNLGALYVEMKRYGDAVVQLKLAIQDPEYRTPERPNNNLAEAYLQSGDCQNAERYALTSTKIQPRFCVGLINLGKAENCLKKYPEAIVAFKAAQEIEECKAYPEPYLRLGTTYLSQHKMTDARIQWKRAKELDPTGPIGKEADGYLRSSQ